MAVPVCLWRKVAAEDGAELTPAPLYTFLPRCPHQDQPKRVNNFPGRLLVCGERRRRRNGEGGMVFPCFLWRSSSAEGSSLPAAFLLLLSLCSPPLPSPSFHAVVCRHAGISGPQNDRPNLSALAPVAKDGRPGSVRASDWCTSWVTPRVIGRSPVLSHSPCAAGRSVNFSFLVCLRSSFAAVTRFAFSPAQFGYCVNEGRVAGNSSA